MNWPTKAFKSAYIAAGGSPRSADSYVSYLNRVDAIVDGLDKAIAAVGMTELLVRMERLPAGSFGGDRNRRDSLSALRKYADLFAHSSPTGIPVSAMASQTGETRPEYEESDVRQLLREAKSLAARCYRLTGKPLGVTGEVAELEAAEKLDLSLVDARTEGYDATRIVDGKLQRIQIKGRAVSCNDRYRGQCPSIKCGDKFDVAMLVLLDRTTMGALEIWEAAEAAIEQRLSGVSSAKQARNALAITQFKSVAEKVWPA